MHLWSKIREVLRILTHKDGNKNKLIKILSNGKFGSTQDKERHPKSKQNVNGYI